MKKYKIVCDINFAQIILQTIIWTILSVVSFGALLPFFGYYFIKIILNNTEIHEY